MSVKNLIVCIIFTLLIFMPNFACAENNITTKQTVFNKNQVNDAVIKNKLFSLTIPKDLRGTYTIKVKKDRICIYDKASKKAGFGGFAFGIKAYKNPADYAEMPGGKKIGELTDKQNILYDIVLKHPTDVQYDYTKGTEAPKSFKALYDLGETIEIKGVKGSKYHKNQGTKGKDLYKDVLEKHLTAIQKKFDSIQLEELDMSYMYNVLAQSGKNVADKVGYVYYDINGDGIDELIIGEITEGEWKGIIYDIYTMVDRKPKHVISGGERNRYFVCDDVFLCNEYSSGALESGVRVYILIANSTELYPQVSFKYDGYENYKNPYFISYSDEKWENVTKEKFNERKKVFDRYERFEFIPLSKVFVSK